MTADHSGEGAAQGDEAALAALVVAGMQGPPVLANLTFWTQRGEHTTSHAGVIAQLFVACVRRWGIRLLQVCDRGSASGVFS